MKKIGFIGMGNMGYAILQGVLSKYAKEDLIFSSKSQEKKERIKTKTGVDYTEDNASLAKNCEILVLAIKPQMYDTVFLEIAKDMPSGQVVISLAPGKSIDELKNSIDTRFDEINFKLDRQEQNIKQLQATDSITLARLQDEARSQIIDKHHYFCYKIKAIDDLSLQSLERAYMYYTNAGGNTFIEGLMKELRQLPRAILTKPEEVN